MMIRRVWIKTIGDNASSAIIARGKRRVTLPNSSASAPPRPLRTANGGLLRVLDDHCRRRGDRGPFVRRLPMKRTLLASVSVLALTLPAVAQEFSVFINMSLVPAAYCSPQRQQPQEPPVAQRPIADPVVATDSTATSADRITSVLGAARAIVGTARE